VDRFTLIRASDGGWKIISLLFYSEPWPTESGTIIKIPSFFIRFPFFNLIHQISNFFLDLACIPLDEQDPEPITPLAISHIKHLP
jgi:hypothetical protein